MIGHILQVHGFSIRLTLCFHLNISPVMIQAFSSCRACELSVTAGEGDGLSTDASVIGVRADFFSLRFGSSFTSSDFLAGINELRTLSASASIYSIFSRGTYNY